MEEVEKFSSSVFLSLRSENLSHDVKLTSEKLKKIMVNKSTWQGLIRKGLASPYLPLHSPSIIHLYT